MRIFLFSLPLSSAYRNIQDKFIIDIVGDQRLKWVVLLLKMPLDIPGFAYAAVVAAGGIFGYYKAGN